jgi:pyruvate,water dikinase
MNLPLVSQPYLLSLHDAQACDALLVGGKAARLAAMLRQGLPVPRAFALTVHAFVTGMTEELEAQVRAAYEHLLSPAPSPFLVAVRSSATAEDLEGASFAGLQETVLNVQGADALVEAIRRVWNSLASPQATAYREHTHLHDTAMAVLVQRQIAATVAGVAFGCDPITGEPVIVVEAVAGLGEALVSGAAEPQQWRVERRGGSHQAVLAPTEPLLNDEQLSELVALVETVSALWGQPQDVEWAWDGEQFWLLQARPITGRGEDWFTERLPSDHHLWTAAFLNERFTQPVSPLGWTLVAEHLEQLALRGPLQLLRAEEIEGPLLKLWRGHPYSRVQAWQRIYKLFPDALLPEDAVRYFPGGDVSLRRAPRWPTLGPRLVLNGLRVLRKNFKGVSPLHNPRAWARYEQRQKAALIRFHFRERHLDDLTDPIPEARALMRQVSDLTGELLDLHRWSLLYADLSYSLLRRLLILRYGSEEGAALAVRLTANIESPTTRMNRELAELAAGVREDTKLRTFLETISQAGAGGEPDPPPALEQWWAALESFIQRYGHRFFSLDFYDRPWEADLPALASFLLALANGAIGEPRAQAGYRHNPSVPGVARPVLELTRDYLRMREAQRFHWQQLLALQRRVALKMGLWWAGRGQLAGEEDVFGLTWTELMAGEPDGQRAAARMARLHRLREQAARAPGWHYPDFLRGEAPLRHAPGGAELVGRAVSPGVARGPARLVAHPGDLARIQPGDILVTASPDPGWTPIFGIIAGLVTERGGQLSHGAVVAREYHLPAVSGIPGLMALLRDGEPLLVDGTQGIIIREEPS